MFVSVWLEGGKQWFGKVYAHNPETGVVGPVCGIGWFDLDVSVAQRSPDDGMTASQELIGSRPEQNSSTCQSGTQNRVLSMWGSGTGLVSQVPCLGNALVVVGILKNDFHPLRVFSSIGDAISKMLIKNVFSTSRDRKMAYFLPLC